MAIIREAIRTVKDNGDVVLSNIIDSNTGESVEYIKVQNPTGITPDGVIYRRLVTSEFGDEIFKRIYSGYADVRWFGVKNSNTGLENTNMLNHCLRVCRNVIIDEDLDIEIDETINYPSLQINLRNGILVPSNTNLVINGKIRFTNTSSAYYGILCLSDVNNVTISGTGTLEGSYLLNYQPSGSGHGVAIYDSQNVKIENLTIKNCLGDGVYVIGRRRDMSSIMCENLNFRKLILEGNSRQGISLVKANQVIIDNCTIRLTGTLNGSVLGCGIDMEPEYHLTVSNVIVKDSTFINNLNNPINMLCLVPTSEIRDISIINNYIQQGGPSGVSYTINIRKGAPDLDSKINNIYIKNNNISLNSTSIQRGISMSNVIDNVEISDNIINKTVAHTTIGGGYRAVSIASAKTIKVSNNTLIGEFDYGIYQEGSYSGNIFLNNNILDKCIYGCYFRQSSNINIKSNTITNVTEAINTASVSDLVIDKNHIQNTLGCAISLRTNVINSKITLNTLVDCAIDTAANTDLSDVERSWISVASSIPASPTRCVDVLNNFFRRAETTPIFRHIQCPDNNTQSCNILENISTTETLIILNLSTTGELKYPHRKFGITAQRPSTLPANYAGPFYDTVEDTLYYWGGAAWESINALATETVKGVVRKSAVVEGIQANDVTNQPLSTATTLEELVTSHNNLVGRYNQVVTLLNETKLKVNQSLNTEKAAGQRTST